MFVCIPTPFLQLIKYGVICMEDLLDDLLKWKWLYISGRLQKPASSKVVFMGNVCAGESRNCVIAQLRVGNTNCVK